MRQPGGGVSMVAERAHGNLRADVRAHAAALRRGVKARRAVEAVAIGKREGGHAELRGALDKRLRLRAAVEKAEGAGACSSTYSSPVSHRRPQAATRSCAAIHAPTGRQAARAPCDSASTSHSSLSQPSDRPPATAAAPWTKGCGDLVTLLAIEKDQRADRR